jgi:hypothetical protein
VDARILKRGGGCAESGSAIRVEKLGMRPGPLRVDDRVSCA